MGIHNIIRLINSSNTLKFPQIERGEFIYKPTIAYLDFTYKLIDAYNAFKPNAPDSNANAWPALFKHVVSYLYRILTRINDCNEIHVFVDYKFPQKYVGRQFNNIRFFDYMVKPNDFSKKELVNAIPLIKRKYVMALVTCPNADLSNHIRCMHELRSLYTVNNSTIEKYVSIAWVLEQLANGDDGWHNVCTACCTNDVQIDPSNIPTIIETLNSLVSYGWFRYILLRGGKIQNRDYRHTAKLPFVHAMAEKYGTNNMSKLIDVYNGDKTKIAELIYSQIPFVTLIYAFPLIAQELKKCVPNVHFYGCEVEAELAITNHIKTYSLSAFPIIYSCDTDLLALLCDVECVLRLELKGSKHSVNYYINPPMFWRQVFGTYVNSSIVRLLCVLKGTDYNKGVETDPLTFESFDAILSTLGVTNFSELTEDGLLFYIANMLKRNEGNSHCKHCAFAVNMYANPRVEHELHEICSTKGIDVEKFLRASNVNVLR